MVDRYIDEIEQQAALFALGALTARESEEFGRRLATGCPLCTAEFDCCNLALSALPLTAPALTPPPALRARVLESIANGQASMIDKMILLRSDETPWRPAPFPGVEMRFLYKRKTMLVRMAAKSRLPAHPHATAEQCLILEGSVSSNGVTANAGDFIYMPAGSTHDVLESHDGALLLIANT